MPGEVEIRNTLWRADEIAREIALWGVYRLGLWRGRLGSPGFLDQAVFRPARDGRYVTSWEMLLDVLRGVSDCLPEVDGVVDLRDSRIIGF